MVTEALEAVAPTVAITLNNVDKRSSEKKSVRDRKKSEKGSACSRW